MVKSGRQTELTRFIPRFTEIEQQAPFHVKNLNIVKGGICDIKIAVTVEGKSTRPCEKPGRIAKPSHHTLRQPIRTEKFNPEIHGIENRNMPLVADSNGNGPQEKTVRCFMTAQRTDKNPFRGENKHLPLGDVGNIQITDRVNGQSGWTPKRIRGRNFPNIGTVRSQDKNLVELGVCKVKPVAVGIQRQARRCPQGHAINLPYHRRPPPG